MEHVVFYPSADGTPAFRRVPSLEDAVNFVEHLRNSAGTTEFSVHALAEVPLTFRAYYHVEIPGEPAREDSIRRRVVVARASRRCEGTAGPVRRPLTWAGDGHVGTSAGR